MITSSFVYVGKYNVKSLRDSMGSSLRSKPLGRSKQTLSLGRCDKVFRNPLQPCAFPIRVISNFCNDGISTKPIKALRFTDGDSRSMMSSLVCGHSQVQEKVHNMKLDLIDHISAMHLLPLNYDSLLIYKILIRQTLII